MNLHFFGSKCCVLPPLPHPHSHWNKEVEETEFWFSSDLFPSKFHSGKRTPIQCTAQTADLIIFFLMISYIYQCPTGPGGNYLGGVPFASSHGFAFRGTCDNKCKPFYSLLFSPSCLINMGLVVSLLLPAYLLSALQSASICHWTLQVT